jgi:hypothetical protein
MYELAERLPQLLFHELEFTGHVLADSEGETFELDASTDQSQIAEIAVSPKHYFPDQISKTVGKKIGIVAARVAPATTDAAHKEFVDVHSISNNAWAELIEKALKTKDTLICQRDPDETSGLNYIFRYFEQPLPNDKITLAMSDVLHEGFGTETAVTLAAGGYIFKHMRNSFGHSEAES